MSLRPFHLGHVLAVCLALGGLTGSLSAAEPEQVFPKAGTVLAPILDFAVPSPNLLVTLHADHLSVSTDDGATWERKRVPEQPLSFFFLDPAHGWIVSSSGLWETTDGAAHWRRRLKSKLLFRVWFVTPEHGFAVGDKKTVLESTDAGKTWKPLAAAAEPSAIADRSAYTGIEFSSNTGFISGTHSPKRPDDALPRQWPQLGLLLQTIDGGVSWKPSSATIFGRFSQVRVSGRTALLPLQFDYEFEWPSEVYRIDLPTGQTNRLFREKDRRVCSVAIHRTKAVVAAIEEAQRVRAGYQFPTGPRPLQVMVFDDAGSIEKVISSDRLTASDCILAVEGATLWLATSEGTIWRLE